MSGAEQIEKSLALENARLAQERRRVEALTAIDQVARRVGASLDLQETLDGIVEAAAELVPCVLAEISLWDEERQMLVLQALRCEPERVFPIGETYPPGEGYTGWVVRNKRPLLVPDVDIRQDIQPDLLPGELAFKAYVGLPLQVGDALIGTLVLVHDQADAFDEDDQWLLEALAGQAAVAIRNARLYNELARRHRELAALNAVAAAINQALDLEMLLANAVERVIEVVGADAGGIRLLDQDGDSLRFVFSQGLSPEYAATIQSVQLRKGIAGHVALTGQPVLIADMWDRMRTHAPSHPHVREALLKEGLRARVEVPLRSRERVVGTLGVASRTPGAFGPADVDLLTAMGYQIGVAIANTQLFEETQRKARELAALNAVAAAINQALDLETLLASGLERAIEVVDADSGGVRLLDLESNTLELVFSQGLSPEYAARVRSIPLGYRVAGHVALTGEPELFSDVTADALTRAYIPDALMEENPRSLAVVPLRSREELVGTLGIGSHTPGTFGPEDVDLLTAIGHQLGTAIENARLRQQALEVERLAAVGRVATSVAHDLRSPLGGIIRSAEFLARSELSEGTRQKLSHAVVALARRLINTTQEILDYTKGGRMVLRLASCDLLEFLEQVIEVLRVDFSDRGIEVIEEWGYIGEVQMDPDRMAQVVYNIAANARDAMPEGGQLTISTHRVDGWVELRFTDTGPGVPPELGKRIFEPFVSHGKREGAGLGLAIARRIVQEHGGKINIESPARGGATFVVRLPLQA